jgi:putative endonuclease
MAIVYIVRCSDGTFYVGQTADLESRIASHNDGLGSSYTARRLPVTLVHHETFPTRAAARVRERQLKRWSAGKKTALIAGDPKTLKSLSKRRQR